LSSIGCGPKRRLEKFRKPEKLRWNATLSSLAEIEELGLAEVLSNLEHNAKVLFRASVGYNAHLLGRAT